MRGGGRPRAQRRTGGSGPARVWGHNKSVYSAGETLKAPVSSEGRNDVLLWYLLVGVLVGLSTGTTGCWGWAQTVRPVLSATSTNVDKWLGRGTGVTAPTYPGPGNCHNMEAGTWVGGEQARPVKTVKVQHALAGATGSDRRYPGGSNGPSGDRYRLGHRPVMDLVCGSMFSQAIVSWPLQWGPASYAAVIGCGLKRRSREAVGPAGAAVGPGSWAYGCTCN